MKCLVHNVDQLTPAGTEDGSLLVRYDNSKVTAVAKREIKDLDKEEHIDVVEVLVTWREF